jgi:hypothetical protein
MKCYNELTCSTLPEIQKESLLWINTHKDEMIPYEGNFWYKINTVDFVQNCPSVVSYCQSLNLKLREVAVLIAEDRNGVPLHTDEGPLISKLNIPILNTKNTITHWYDKNNNLLDSLEVIKPIIFNSSIPHKVKINENAQLPRIVLACMFFNDPIDYLKND